MKKKSPLSLAILIVSGILFSNCQGFHSQSSSKTVMVWHSMTDWYETFLKLAKEYEHQTGIKVVFERSAFA